MIGQVVGKAGWWAADRLDALSAQVRSLSGVDQDAYLRGYADGLAGRTLGEKPPRPGLRVVDGSGEAS